MLTVTLLVRAARRRSPRARSSLAGVVAGFLPLAHLPTLLALAMVTPFLALLLARRPWHLRTIPWRGWIVFHVVWIAVAMPQLLTQLGGGAGALAAFRLDLGWVAGIRDPWWWFWLKNLGLFIPLGLLALGARPDPAAAGPSRAARLHADLRGGEHVRLPALGLGQPQDPDLLVPRADDPRGGAARAGVAVEPVGRPSGSS